MDQGAGKDATTSTASAPSSEALQASTMGKPQANGGGGRGDVSSTASVPAGAAAERGPSEEQIASMAAAKAKGKKSGKKNGFGDCDFPTHPEPISPPRRGRGGVRGGGGVPRPPPEPHYNEDNGEPYSRPYNQRGISRKSGYQRGNPRKPKNSYAPPRQHHDDQDQDDDFYEHNLEAPSRTCTYPGQRGRGRGFSNAPSKSQLTPRASTSLPTPNNRKERVSPHKPEPLASCVSQFITSRPQPIQEPTNNLSNGNSSTLKSDLKAFLIQHKEDSATVTSVGTPVYSISVKLPFPISFEKIQVPGVVSKASTPETSAATTAPPPAPEPTAPPKAKAPVPKPRNRTLMSRPTTPVSEPMPITASTSNTSVSDNEITTPTHPTPAAIPTTAPTPPSSSSSSSQRESESCTPSLLQLMEERKLKEKANIDKILAVKQPVPRPRPALPARSLPNGLRNHNDSRTPSVPRDVIEHQKSLPIYPVRLELIEMIKKHPVVIVIGDPGSGKSTQLPQYLLEAGFGNRGRIGVTEPRRVAAKTLSERVAHERGERGAGGTVGYAVRFERQMSARTVIKYMTDGVLVQECANPAHLEEYSVVIIDEAHERSVPTDICFGLLKREAERDGSKLKIIISSATLEQEKFRKYFDGAPVYTIPGNENNPKIKHKPESLGQVENYLEEAVTIIKGINRKLDFPKGDILVFLTGQDEIEELTSHLLRQIEEINRPDSQIRIVQCYGALTFDEQMKIFVPALDNYRKVILATNIAETSITIKGVVYVIDCGYFKESFYNPANGISYLVKKRITKFQAKQRYGRAGRTEEGICFRVYSERDFEEMEEAGAPEITRCNLESIILDLAAMGFTGWEFNGKGKMELANFDLMDLPSVDAFVEALTHLQQLSAVEVAGTGIKITELGVLMASFHLDPSLSRVLIEALRLGCEQEALKIVALLSANYSNIFYGHSVSKDVLKEFYHPDGDLLTFLKMYNGWLEIKKEKKVEWCKARSLQHRVFQEAEDIRCQIQSILKRLKERNPQKSEPTSEPPPERLFENIRKSFVAGYFRQFAFKKPSGPAYRHLANVAAPDEDVYVHPSSVFSNCGPPNPPRWIIYIAMLVTSKPYMRAVTVINSEWIRDYAPDFAENLEKLNVLAPQAPPQFEVEDDEDLENVARRLTMEF